ncbi:MAG: hypothetical protein JWL95_167, partial [Gemmatimonadetes bacterium]|nr:hypothetical protein [Gemmatimonadota bacterium]
IQPLEDECGFSPEAREPRREAFILPPDNREDGRLVATLVRLCDETLSLSYSPERMVTTLRAAWERSGSLPHVDRGVWSVLYRDALTRSLALYFDEVEQ